MSSAFCTDAIGQIHPPFAKGSARIVSLVPSLTELIVDLGLAGSLVGRTGFCIHPQDVVNTIPKVGGTKDVNLDKIRKLAPTHVVLNIDENEKPVADALAQFVPHVIVTHPLTLRDNLDVYRLFGQLFGVEAEAGRKIGLLELAHGGTLFLDEVADMPLETQGKILRVLIDQTFTRVGGTNRVQVDARVICSTTRDALSCSNLPGVADK